MISLSVVKSTLVKVYRQIKVIQHGAKTADQSSPFGDDSNPIKDMVAVYAETQEAGEPVIIGYLGKSALAAIGEKRLYSTNEAGEIKSVVWLKNDGSLQLNMGENNAVQFQQLETILSQYNTSINTELAKIAASIASLGGSYAVQPLTLNLDASKIESIKVP